MLKVWQTIYNSEMEVIYLKTTFTQDGGIYDMTLVELEDIQKSWFQLAPLIVTDEYHEFIKYKKGSVYK